MKVTRTDVKIRPYEQRDEHVVQSLIEQLQQHIADLDPYKINKPLSHFNAVTYVRELRESLQRSEGMIFVACIEDAVVGFIAGVIDRSPEDADHFAVQQGIIKELVTDAATRGGGVGTALMRHMEDYFRQHNCHFSRTDCFSPNVRAHAFYEKLGYEDRFVNVMKPLL